MLNLRTWHLALKSGYPPLLHLLPPSLFFVHVSLPSLLPPFPFSDLDFIRVGIGFLASDINKNNIIVWFFEFYSTCSITFLSCFVSWHCSLSKQQAGRIQLHLTKMDLRELVVVGILVLDLSCVAYGNLAFPVVHKFKGGQSSLAALKAHDDRRRGRFLSAVDLSLGGNGLPSETGFVSWSFFSNSLGTQTCRFCYDVVFFGHFSHFIIR